MKAEKVCAAVLALWAIVFAKSATGAVPAQQWLQNKVLSVRNQAIVDVSEFEKEVLTENDPAQLLADVRTYRSDRDASVRQLAMLIETTIGNKSVDPNLRQQVASDLSVACLDSEQLVWGHASEYLWSFSPGDFSPATKSRIRSMLTISGREKEAALLIGISGQSDQISSLTALEKKFPDSGDPGFGPGWAAHLALARLGSTPEISYCVDRIEKCKSPRLRVSLSRQLAYMKQPQAVKALGRMIASRTPLPSLIDDSLPGELPYGQPLDVAARVLKGFPVPPKEVSKYTAEDAVVAEEWISSRYIFEFVDNTPVGL